MTLVIRFIHIPHMYTRLLLLMLLVVTLFGVSYMVYALVDSLQRGALKINLIFAVVAPPAYIFLLFVYAASKVADDL